MNRQTRLPLGCALVWLAAVTGHVFAQGPVPRPKFGSYIPPAASATGHYGILGEVAKPGVYSAEGPEVTLQELIQQAGGMSANGSPAIRLVRQNRIAQGRYFNPAGRDPLLPGDIVLVENLYPQAAGAQAVSIGLIGVMDRPVVVPMRADNAQIGTVMLALGQSSELARSVQLIVPSRQRPPTSASAPLANGTVLILDPKLLVAGNLPSFPEAIPMTRVAEPSMTQAATPAPIGVPQPALSQLPPSIPDNRLPVTNAARNNGEVEATMLPFSNGSQRPQANTASLPAPGSRLQPVPAKPVEKPKKSTVPLLNADSEIVSSVDDLDLGTEDEPAIEAAAPAGFSFWQMLGIGGTVASLVGLAVLSRNVIGKDSPSIRTTMMDDDVVPESIRKRSAMPAPQMLQKHRRFDLPEPTLSAKRPRIQPKPIAETQRAEVASAQQTEPHDLAELLAMRGPIETESVVLPHGLKLRRAPLSSTPFYRIDDAAELPGAPHERPTTAATPQRSLDDAATMKVPAPHFSTAIAAADGPAMESAIPEMTGGKAIERALHQLLRGKLS